MGAVGSGSRRLSDDLSAFPWFLVPSNLQDTFDEIFVKGLTTLAPHHPCNVMITEIVIQH